MRGLKPNQNLKTTWEVVASFTDAWIETANAYAYYGPSAVASFTDAWIETGGTSRPLSKNIVASFTDAWIETRQDFDIASGTVQSHPLRMRGLKQMLTLLLYKLPSRILYGCVD